LALLILIVPVRGILQEHRGISYIREAEELIAKDKLKEAVEKLEKGIKSDRNNPEAYYLLGETYRKLGTLGDRIESSRAFKKALKLKPDDIKFLYSWGLLKVRQGFKAEAEHTFKKIIGLDSTFSDAYQQLALLHYKKASRYKGMVSARGLIDMTNFGIEEQEKAIDYMEQALAYNDTSDQIFYNLGLFYIDDQNWSKMISLFSKTLTINPKNKEAHLFLGYAKQKNRQFREAEREYELAKSLMTSEEAEALESVEMLLNENDRKELAMTGADRESFWIEKNPSYLTGYNERKLEHYSRFAYVNLKFGDPEMGLTGWKTERGEVYLRYGEPQKITRTRPEIISSTRRSFGGVSSKEIWDYGELFFVFEDNLMNGNYRLTNESKLLLESVKSEIPEFYVSDFDKRRITFFRMLSTSRGENGRTNLDVFFEIPLDTTIMNNLDALSRFFIERGVFVFDENWNKIKENTGSERFYVNMNRYDEGYGSAITSVRIEIDSGFYNIAGEFQDWDKLTSGSFKEKIVIPDYASRDSLMMSDLIMGREFEDITEEFGPGLRFFPQPSLIFEKETPVELYFEIYNLLIGPEQKTNFKLDASITLIPEKVNILTKLFRKAKDLISENKRKTSLTNTFNFEGTERTEKLYLTFHIDALKSGKYLFKIELTDIPSGKKVSKTREIFIL